MKSIVLTCLLSFLVMTLSVSAYNITYTGSDNIVASAVDTETPSVNWSESCNVYMNLRQTATSNSAYTLTNSYRSPGTTEIATGNPSLPYNISCKLMNTFPFTTSTALDGFYESTIHSTNSSLTLDSWLTTTYECDFDANELFIYDNTDSVDSYGNHPFGYVIKTGYQCGLEGACAINPLTGNLGEVLHYVEYGGFSECGNDMTVDSSGFSPFACTSAGNPQHWGRNDWTVTPFNSMASGRVNISVMDREYTLGTDCGGIQETYQYYYWDSVLNTTTDLGTTFPLTAELTLIADREYWLFIGSRICGTKVDINTCTVTYINSSYNISIRAVVPDWDCKPWSDCEDGTESRVCTDTTGKVKAKNEFRDCDVTILENATLGFESAEARNVTRCSPDWSWRTAVWGLFDGTSCDYIPTSFEVDVPLNWTITPGNANWNKYWVTMTTEWASEGTRSLKLWSIPPMAYQYDGSSCYTNTSSGDFPIASRIISNTSFSVGYDVTFPSTYMRIRMDVSGCLDQVRQSTALYINNGTIGESLLCNEICYASICDSVPDGRFAVDILNTSTGLSILGADVYHHAINLSEGLDIDLSQMGLVVGENYTISISVLPQDPQDTRGNCVMFDDVRYDVLAESYIDTLLDGVCESKCCGTNDKDWCDATITDNGGCVVKRTYNSMDCEDPSVRDDILNRRNYCDVEDNNLLLRYNAKIRRYQEVDCELGCSDGSCLSAEVVDPTEATVDSLDELYAVLLNVTFWVSLAILIICILVPYYTKMSDAMPIVLFGIAQFVFILSLLGVLPLYFAIAEIVLAVAIIAYFITKPARGG